MANFIKCIASRGRGAKEWAVVLVCGDCSGFNIAAATTKAKKDGVELSWEEIGPGEIFPDDTPKVFIMKITPDFLRRLSFTLDEPVQYRLFYKAEEVPEHLMGAFDQR